MFNQIFSFIWETAKLVLLSLLIILPIRYFIVQPFFVLGASMEPNFENGDYLIIDEISYRFHDPKRDDVIVFKYPHPPFPYYIKRVIGLPGETVELNGEDIIIKNKEHPEGFKLQEDYLPKGLTYESIPTKPLGADEYFVMGDNRNASYDSRKWGVLNKKFIIGKVWVRLYPFQKIELFDYNYGNI